MTASAWNRLMVATYWLATGSILAFAVWQRWWLVALFALSVTVWGLVTTANLGQAASVMVEGRGRIRAPRGVGLRAVRFVAGAFAVLGLMLLVAAFARHLR